MYLGYDCIVSPLSLGVQCSQRCTLDMTALYLPYPWEYNAVISKVHRCASRVYSILRSHQSSIILDILTLSSTMAWLTPSECRLSDRARSFVIFSPWSKPTLIWSSRYKQHIHRMLHVSRYFSFFPHVQSVCHLYIAVCVYTVSLNCIHLWIWFLLEIKYKSLTPGLYYWPSIL
jgi:hypothetical protein